MATACIRLASSTWHALAHGACGHMNVVFFSTWKRFPLNLTSSLFFFFFSFAFHPARWSRRGFSFCRSSPCASPVSFLAFVQGERLLAFDHGSRAVFVATPACVESRDWHRPTASRSVYHQHPRERNEHGRHGSKRSVGVIVIWLVAYRNTYKHTGIHAGGLRCKRKYTQWCALPILIILNTFVYVRRPSYAVKGV